METLEEKKLIAAATLILRTLDSNKIITKKAREVLVNLGIRLSTMAKIDVDEDKALDIRFGIPKPISTSSVIGFRRRLRFFMPSQENQHAVVHDRQNFEPEQFPFRSSQDDGVDDHQVVSSGIDSVERDSISHGADSVVGFRRRLRFFMPSIENQHVVVHNRKNFEPEQLCFRSNQDDGVDDHPEVSSGDDSVQRDSISHGAEVFIVDLVNLQEIPDLKSIAAQAFISARKDVLDDCLFILDIEKLSAEDVLKMDWDTLNFKIRKWAEVMRMFVRIYLAREKLLCQQIFGQERTFSFMCFLESSKASMLQVLNFAEAVAVRPHQPEKLFGILDMVEALTDVMPDIESLYSDEAGSYIRREWQDVLTRVGDCIKATLIEFENAVVSKTSHSAFPGGGIHPATLYAMDYIRNLTKDDSVNGNQYPIPMDLHITSLISILECNLEKSSKLYKDEALGHLFMMNNIHYIAEKVTDSELGNIVGDEWIGKRVQMFRQYAMSYEQATWKSLINLLRVSDPIPKPLLRKRLYAFCAGFEEIYKNQTGWSIPNIQLRLDLMLPPTVIQVYRTFIGRFSRHIGEKHIKYTGDDIERYMLDLFEGDPKSLHI